MAGTAADLTFSLTLFGLVMIGSDCFLPFLLSAPALASRTVLVSIWGPGWWIGSILAGRCAPAGAVGQRRTATVLGPDGVGGGGDWEDFCSSLLIDFAVNLQLLVTSRLVLICRRWWGCENVAEAWTELRVWSCQSGILTSVRHVQGSTPSSCVF